MNESGKVALATALSLAVHASLFGFLALMPGASAVPAPEPPADERSLEVTVTAQEEPAVPPAPSLEEIATAPMPQAGGIRTQIDPENLKKAERPPEHATAIAAHDSEAASGRAPTPAPTPHAPDDTQGLTVAPAANAKGEQPGIDALGNFGKAVGNAIGVRCEFYRQTQKHKLAVGEVRLQFALDAKGSVSDIKILSNTAGPVNAACAESAVREAHLPPIPAERLAQLPGGRMRIEYIFTIYHP